VLSIRSEIPTDIAMKQVIPLSISMVKQASVNSAQAFMDDPYTKYVIPNIEDRANLRYGFEYYLRLALLGRAQAYTTSPACEGVAVWQDSLKKEPFGLLFQVNPLLQLKCGWLYVIRELLTNRLAEKIKKEFAPKHHIYLALLAVHPDSQGKGLASMLLKALLKELDRDRLPCYLETQNLQNTSMYGHFGFKVIHQVLIPGTDLPLYMMLRQ
jgi:ribosomal protein S18 acetylase RimI-like enzyme